MGSALDFSFELLKLVPVVGVLFWVFQSSLKHHMLLNDPSEPIFHLEGDKVGARCILEQHLQTLDVILLLFVQDQLQ